MLRNVQQDTSARRSRSGCAVSGQLRARSWRLHSGVRADTALRQVPSVTQGSEFPQLMDSLRCGT